MFIGFDIGGTKCAVLLGNVDDTSGWKIIDKRVFATNKPVYEMIEMLFCSAESILSENNLLSEDIAGIGISCGGPLSSKKGLVLSPPNLPGWDNIPIVKMAETRFNKPCLLQNDANACAVAEWKHGAGKGLQNIIFLTFGTGMGAGLILDGKLYSGTTDLAGEVGHLRLAEMGPVGFGKAGSFEGFCSGGGLAQLGQTFVRQKLQMGETVSFCKNLDELPLLTAKSIAEAAAAGDITACEIYKMCAKYLGKGLALLIDILNPQMIILGSIFGRAESLLRETMEKEIRKEAISFSREVCTIVPAGLSENIGDVAALCLAQMSMGRPEI